MGMILVFEETPKFMTCNTPSCPKRMQSSFSEESIFLSLMKFIQKKLLIFMIPDNYHYIDYERYFHCKSSWRHADIFPTNSVKLRKN